MAGCTSPSPPALTHHGGLWIQWRGFGAFDGGVQDLHLDLERLERRGNKARVRNREVVDISQSLRGNARREIRHAGGRCHKVHTLRDMMAQQLPCPHPRPRPRPRPPPPPPVDAAVAVTELAGGACQLLGHPPSTIQHPTTILVPYCRSVSRRGGCRLRGLPSLAGQFGGGGGWSPFGFVGFPCRPSQGRRGTALAARSRWLQSLARTGISVRARSGR
jgi:hypothetical protein